MLFIPPVRLLDRRAERQNRIAKLAYGLARIKIEIHTAEPQLLAVDRRRPWADATERIDHDGCRAEQPTRHHQPRRAHARHGSDRRGNLTMREVLAAQDIAFAGPSTLGRQQM